MQKKPQNIEENLIEEMEDLIKSIKLKDNNIGENDLADKIGYRPGYISECRSRGKVSVKFINSLKAYLATLENPMPKPAENDYTNQPIIQVVLNLSYIGKKNADSIDKMADSNLLNAKSIATLVNIISSNSDLAAQLIGEPTDPHTDDGLPIEAFLGKHGAKAISKQKGLGKIAKKGS